jgi:LysR family transcriptional regulator, glycine cleavage system transcriptional activator
VRRPLPPLNALRAFEATARHLSFSKAAEELHVTPAALSHQIRGLEDLLGLKLFHRRARSIELTEPARLIYPGIRTGFEAIREAVDRLGRGQQDRILVVSSTPGFTAKWLVPRLYRFLARNPEIETRITASAAYANFASDGVDVGIRLSSGVHPDLYVEKLSDEWLLPLCSPRLLDGERRLRSPQDLAHFPLIQVDLPGLVPTWADWLRMAQIDGIDSTRGLRLNVADHALDAASEGMGVVLAYKMVASRDILLGRLVPPFGPDIPVPGRSYYFVCARGHEKRANVKAFRDWVFAEMEETHASLATALSQRPDKGSDPPGLTPYARAIYREAPQQLTPAAAAPAAAAGRRAPSPSRQGPRRRSR